MRSDARPALRLVASATSARRPPRAPTVGEGLAHLARACEAKPEWWKLGGSMVITASLVVGGLGWWVVLDGIARVFSAP